MTTADESVTVPTESSYNGRPTLILPHPDADTMKRKPAKAIVLGVTKLRAVLKYQAEVQAFIEKHHKTSVETPEMKRLAKENADLKEAMERLKAMTAGK